MFDSHEESDLVEMSQRERDRLKVLYGVSRKERSQKEAARLLKLTTRQVRRLVRRLDKQGDQGLVHGLRGQPSNHRLATELRQKVLAEYRRCYAGFGPTLASEKLTQQQGLKVKADTLRLWLLGCGNGNGVAMSIGNAGRGAVALASWCRWTPRFMIGWKDAVSRWC
jgi:transposase